MIIPSKIQISISAFLNESYGIKEFNNKEYISSINHFIKFVLRPELSKTYNIEYDSEIPDVEDGINFKYFNISNLGCTWIQSLDIYVSHGDELYAFVLSTFHDAAGKRTFNVIRNGIEQAPFKLNGNVIEYMSIVMCIPYKLPSDEELFGVITHEIKHGFDYVRKDFISNYLNKDIIFANDFLIRNKKYMAVPEYWYLEPDDLEQRIKKMSSFDIMCAICNTIYFLNSSEMSARLNNYRAELMILKTHGMGYMRGEMIHLYENILSFLELLIKLVPDKVKHEFSETYINDFEHIYSSDDGTNDKSFRHRGNNNQSGFNNLIKFFVTKVNTFLSKCVKIRKNIIKI